MLFDIAFAFLVILGYLVAIIMANKSSKTEITLSDSDIDKIAEKVVEKVEARKTSLFYTLGDKKIPMNWDGIDESDFNAPTIDESPVVVKSKTDGMEATGDWGDVQPVSDKIDAKTLESLKGLKKK